MFGPDEHRYAELRIRRALDDVEKIRDDVRGVNNDLFEDAPDRGESCRDLLREVSMTLGSLLAKLDTAASELPQPQTVMFPGWE